MIGLVKWRLILQWVGSIIMVPSVIVGTAVNFGWVDIGWSQPAFTGVVIALVPLVGSIICTMTYLGIRNNLGWVAISNDERKIRDMLKAADGDASS